MASSRTTSAPALALVIAAKAVSISWGERASRLCSRNRNVRAASSASRNWDALLGLAGFHRTATRDTSGSTSLSTSNCFPIRSGAIIDTPVTFSLGACKVGHESGAQVVDNDGIDDRDRPGRLLGHLARSPTYSHDDVYLQTNEVGGKSGVSIVRALSPSGFNRDALTFHIAQVAEALPEGVQTSLSYRVRSGTRRYVTYPGHLLCRLGRSHAEWRKSEADSENNCEPNQPHAAGESSRTPRRAPSTARSGV